MHFKITDFRIILIHFHVVSLLSLDVEEDNTFAVLIESKTTETRSTENAATCAFDVFGILLWTFHMGPERTMLYFLIPGWIQSSGSQKIIFGLVNHVHLIQKSLRESKCRTPQCHSFRVIFWHIIADLKEETQTNTSSFQHRKMGFPSEIQHHLCTGPQAISNLIILSKDILSSIVKQCNLRSTYLLVHICLWWNLH